MIWCEDECHFHQNGTITRMWVPPEIKDPVILQEPSHKKISLFGSINTVNGQFVYRFSTIFNAETFLEHLNQILSYRPPNKKILLRGCCTTQNPLSIIMLRLTKSTLH